MALDGHDAELVGSYTGTFFYGVYLTVALQCSKLLYERHKAHRGHTYLTVTHTSLFLLISARCICGAARAMNAWKYANVSRGVIDTGGYSSPMSLVVNIIYVLVTLISDAFLVYRTSIVWHNSLRILAIPVALSVADAATGVWWIYCLAIFDGSRAFPTDIVVSVTVFRALTAVLNVLCTGLIAYRVLGISRRMTVDNSLTRAVTLVVESAAVSTFISLCQITTLTAKSFSIFIFTDMSVPAIGIVFSCIIVRVSQGRSLGDSSSSGITSELRWSSRSPPPEPAVSLTNIAPPDTVVLRQTSRENLNRSTSTIIRVAPPPPVPAFGIITMQGET
ncbi:hypothetical protein BDZ89DRAFT_343454 [Hymenopellis radicata]|nr:hypothetical protein BDZ89DRAFT_343454 [Hymenopellis radicata]